MNVTGFLEYTFMVDPNLISLTLILMCIIALITGMYTALIWIIRNINKTIVYIMNKISTKEYMLKEMPKNYKSMVTGLVLYNTISEKYMSVEEIWNGYDSFEPYYLWTDSTVTRLIDQNGHRNSEFSWEEMITVVGREIHACLLVPAKIYAKDTFFDTYRGYFMAPTFLHAYKFTNEMDGKAIRTLEKLLNESKP